MRFTSSVTYVGTMKGGCAICKKKKGNPETKFTSSVTYVGNMKGHLGKKGGGIQYIHTRGVIRLKCSVRYVGTIGVLSCRQVALQPSDKQRRKIGEKSGVSTHGA